MAARNAKCSISTILLKSKGLWTVYMLSSRHSSLFIQSVSAPPSLREAPSSISWYDLLSFRLRLLPFPWGTQAYSSSHATLLLLGEKRCVIRQKRLHRRLSRFKKLQIPVNGHWWRGRGKKGHRRPQSNEYCYELATFNLYHLICHTMLPYKLYVTATNNFFFKLETRSASAYPSAYFRAVALLPKLCDGGFALSERQERTPGNYNLRQNRWKT